MGRASTPERRPILQVRLERQGRVELDAQDRLDPGLRGGLVVVGRHRLPGFFLPVHREPESVAEARCCYRRCGGLHAALSRSATTPDAMSAGNALTSWPRHDWPRIRRAIGEVFDPHIGLTVPLPQES